MYRLCGRRWSAQRLARRSVREPIEVVGDSASPNIGEARTSDDRRRTRTAGSRDQSDSRPHPRRRVAIATAFFGTPSRVGGQIHTPMAGRAGRSQIRRNASKVAGSRPEARPEPRGGREAAWICKRAACSGETSATRRISSTVLLRQNSWGKCTSEGPHRRARSSDGVGKADPPGPQLPLAEVI